MASLLFRFTSGALLGLALALPPLRAQAQLGGGTGDTVVLRSGVKYWTHVPGTGAHVAKGHRAWVHYRGLLTDGRIFDTSSLRGKPLKFSVGRGEVIPGVDEVVALMRVGQKVTAFIPADRGYGANGQLDDSEESGTAYRIPPNADLIFDLELMKTN